ncbi:MAG: class I SAM-dependent methyltransferase [Planctomycetales bacterium]|nr:class I SAM-dependent methyltransferase [Planctomycetales bacterium]
MTSAITDYRHSHTSADKPRSYSDQFHEARNVKALYWRLEQQVLDSVLSPMSLSENATLVDFACGTGRVLGHLQSRFSRAVGVDISEPMISEARQNVADAEFFVGDATRGEIHLGFQPDVITAFRFFLNAQPELRSEALRWMHENLASSGRLVCNFHLNPSSLVGLTMNALKSLRGWDAQPMLSLRESFELLQAHGFRVKQAIGYGYLYYGRRRVWGPMPLLLTIESVMTRCQLLPNLARNFILVAEKA